LRSARLRSAGLRRLRGTRLPRLWLPCVRLRSARLARLRLRLRGMRRRLWILLGMDALGLGPGLLTENEGAKSRAPRGFPIMAAHSGRRAERRDVLTLRPVPSLRRGPFDTRL
jgi:hypothetical protein